MPYYVSPEQVMSDRADYARKGIARGRALAAAVYEHGVAIVAENPGARLRKISEIYDRIAFAGVGRYNEFDALRVAGVRHADVKGYQFSRDDVDARSLANAYAQMLGNAFTHEMKPMEVEILVAEVGHNPGEDRLFRILFDGQLFHDETHTVLGGETDAIAGRIDADSIGPDADLSATLKTLTSALAGEGRTLGPADLEVAVLSRALGRRAFQRFDTEALTELLA